MILPKIKLKNVSQLSTGQHNYSIKVKEENLFWFFLKLEVVILGTIKQIIFLSLWLYMYVHRQIYLKCLLLAWCSLKLNTIRNWGTKFRYNVVRQSQHLIKIQETSLTNLRAVDCWAIDLPFYLNVILNNLGSIL